jgi:hypothetical protein
MQHERPSAGQWHAIASVRAAAVARAKAAMYCAAARVLTVPVRQDEHTPAGHMRTWPTLTQSISKRSLAQSAPRRRGDVACDVAIA